MPRAMSNALDAVNYTKAPKACCARALVRMLKVFDCSLDQDGNTTSYEEVGYTFSLDCGIGRISELCCTTITQHPDKNLFRCESKKASSVFQSSAFER